MNFLRLMNINFKESCEDQYKFNRKLTVALKEADSHLEPRDTGAALAKQNFFEGMKLLR